MNTKLLTLLALISLSFSAIASDTALKNNDIVELIKAGLGEDLVAKKISGSDSYFDMSPKSMIALKKDGVPDSIISLMLQESIKTQKKLRAKINVEIQAYSQGNPESQKKAFQFLKSTQAIALPQLREALSSSTADLRAGAAKALGELGDTSAAPTIRDMLVDSDQNVRFAAADALAKLRDKPAITIAQKAIVSAAPPLDGYLMFLGLTKDTEYVGFICTRLLKDADPITRGYAAWALGEIGSERGVDALEQAMMNDENLKVKAECAMAIGKISPPSGFDMLVEICRTAPKIRVEALTAIGNYPANQSVPFLVDAIGQQLTPLEQKAVLDGLRQHTNRSFGLDPEAWKKWLNENINNLSAE